VLRAKHVRFGRRLQLAGIILRLEEFLVPGTLSGRPGERLGIPAQCHVSRPLE
jgi:hypothetical protein